MNKVKITKDGVTQEVKERYLNSFLGKGWKVVAEKKVSKIGNAKATADVIEEETPTKVEEEPSMPINNQGEE